MTTELEICTDYIVYFDFQNLINPSDASYTKYYSRHFFKHREEEIKQEMILHNFERALVVDATHKMDIAIIRK